MPRVLNQHHLDRSRPPDSVYVGRPTRWGNPFVVENGRGRETAVAMHKTWLLSMLEKTPGLQEELEAELRGKDLICWCAPLPCHADVLLELANKERGDGDLP